MKKNKNTKKALLTSFISLLICLATFIGATFAWFTDSETSGTNKIQSGNLDIKLEYSKTLEDGSWKPVTEDTKDLFTDLEGNDMLWEPGAASVVYLKITNAGTLAFKYNLGVNVINELVGKNVNDETFKLSDYIMFGQVEFDDEDLAYTTREEAIDALTTSKNISNGYALTGNMNAEDEKVIALVVYMPENVGNVANYKTGTTAPEINMGISLVATQYTKEKDSYDDQYDKDSKFDFFADETKTTTPGEETKFVLPLAIANEGEQTTVIFPANVLEGENTLTAKVSPVLTANNKFVVSSDGVVGAIDLTVRNADGYVISEFKNESLEPVAATVETYVAKNLTNVSLVYNNGEGVQPTDVTYDKTTGKLTFKTVHFSTFVIGANEVAYVEENNTAYLTLEDATEYAQDKNVTITLLKDIDFSEKYAAGVFHRFVLENDTLDLNGYSISNRNASIIFDGDNMIVQNGKFIGTNGASYGLFVGDGYYEDRIAEGIVLEDLEFIGGVNVFAAEVTIREMLSKTTANAKTYYAVWGDEAARITVESGTFESESTKGGSVIHAYDGSNGGETAYVLIKGGNYIASNDNVEMFGNKDYIKVSGGTFNRNPENNLLDGYKTIDNGNGTWTVVAK